MKKAYFIIIIITFLFVGCEKSADTKKTLAKEANKAVVEKEATQNMGGWKVTFLNKDLQNRTTKSGEKHNWHNMIASHISLPFGSKVKIVNPITKKSVIVKIIDRGPENENEIAVSYSAAEKLGIIKNGSGVLKCKIIYEPKGDFWKATRISNRLNGRTTASGKKYNKNKFVASHKSLAFGTKVKVINILNDKSTVVTIVDRGPKNEDEINISFVAAKKIDMLKGGIAKVKVEVLK